MPVYVLDCTLLKKSLFVSNICYVFTAQDCIPATMNLEIVMIVLRDVFDHVRLRDEFIYPVRTKVGQYRLQSV